MTRFILLTLFAITPALAQEPLPTCHGVINPNVTQDTIKKTICVSGWTATVRPPVSFTNGLKQTLVGGPRHKALMRLSELDHCIPLELGGAPADPKNLWLQIWDGECAAHFKDTIENGLKTAVCNGKITLEKAQEMVTHWCDPAVKNNYSEKYVPPAKKRLRHHG